MLFCTCLQQTLVVHRQLVSMAIGVFSTCCHALPARVCNMVKRFRNDGRCIPGGEAIMPMQGIPLTSLAGARAFSHTAAWSITCRCPSPLLCASAPASCGVAACSCPSLTCALTAMASWQHGTRCAVHALSLYAASVVVISDGPMLVSIAFAVHQRTSSVHAAAACRPAV